MKRFPSEGVFGRIALREAASAEYGQVMGLVRAAVRSRYESARNAAGQTGYDTWFDVEAMFADRVIVCKDGRYWQFDYSIDDTNMVKLGEPKEVIEQFLPVALKESIARESIVLVAEDGDSTGLVRLLEAAASDAAGKTWDAILIRAGTSKNRFFYSDAVLREAAPLFEGARVYVKSDLKHLKEDVKDPEKLFGWFSGVSFTAGKSVDTGFLAGQLNVGEQFAPLRETIAAAWKKGKKDLVGFSINAYSAPTTKTLREGVKVVPRITKVSSVDLIVDPAAGGALVRLVEAADSKEQGDMKLRESMQAKVKAKFPQLDVANLSDDELEQRYAEAIAPAATGARADTQIGTPVTREELNAYMEVNALRESARSKINATTLPAPIKEVLIGRFNKLSRFTDADVDTEIKNERDLVVRVAESMGFDAGKVKLAYGDIQVGDRSKQVNDMLDAFFDPQHKDHRSAQSIRECYIEITGDVKVTGRMENVNRSRLAESVGMALREGVDTTGFSNVLGSSLTRRMVQDYRNASEYDGWRKVTGAPVPLNDFRQQVRVRFGGYGDLATVNQGAAYPALASPTDEAPTYTPAKRGGTEDVTLESIKNDDVGLVRRIPVRMSRAAKRTLAKFVFDFFRSNAAIYDSVAFFHASHGNLGSTGFSATEYGVVRVAMGKQTELSSADRLGIYPAMVLYPLDLQETVWNAFQRNTNLDKTFVQQLNPELIPVWYWTDTNDWCAVANPDDLQTIEIGFLDGQEEPQLFVQDMPNVGSMFSNDKLTYKIRHIYGGGVVDFRGAYKEVV